MYADQLTSTNEDVCSFFNFGQFSPDLIDSLVRNYVPQRVKKKIFNKVIIGNAPKDYEYLELDNASHYKKTLMIDDNLFELQ